MLSVLACSPEELPNVAKLVDLDDGEVIKYYTDFNIDVNREIANHNNIVIEKRQMDIIEYMVDLDYRMSLSELGLNNISMEGE